MNVTLVCAPSFEKLTMSIFKNDFIPLDKYAFKDQVSNVQLFITL